MSGAQQQAWLSDLAEGLGAGGLLRADCPDDQSSMVAYCREWRGRFESKPLAVARPANTAEMVAVVKACHEAGVAMVSQGGNTGLMGGAVANGEREQVIISLDRMRRMIEVNPVDACLVAEAGVTLAEASVAAAAQGMRVPIDLASAGSATLGGVVACNAGGSLTLRYGNTRPQVLGLEVVLADGRCWSGLGRLRKDNAGYDLKQCFIGSEGTLGIITKVALALQPAAASSEVAWLAVPSVEAAIALLARLRKGLGEQLSACELMPAFGVQLACKHLTDERCPVDQGSAWHLLVQADSSRVEAGLVQALDALLVEAEAAAEITDAVLAASVAQARSFWRLREGMSDAQRVAGLSIKHDVAVPMSKLSNFVQDALQAVEGACPGIRPCVFGHLGDGSLHFNLTRPEAMSDAAFAELEPALNTLVFDRVQQCGGSIAAEHGVGQLRAATLRERLDPVHWQLMKQLKTTLDPRGLLNPGKVI